MGGRCRVHAGHGTATDNIRNGPIPDTGRRSSRLSKIWAESGGAVEKV